MSFTIDRAALARVLNEPDAVAALRRRADTATNDARQNGPHGAHPGRHLVDLIAVGESHTTSEGGVVDIDWPSSFWHLVEFGSINNPPYRPVTRAAQNAGLQVIDSRGAQ